MKTIALINPSKPQRSANVAFNEMFEQSREFIRPWHIAPLNLLTIASYLPNAVDIEFINEDFTPVDFDKPYDLVAITAMTLQAPRAYVIASEFKKRKVPVAMGGIHPSVMPDEALKYADYVFVGEAELTFPEFLKDFEEGRCKRIYSSENRLFDMENSLLPRYDLLAQQHLSKGKDFFNMIPVQASRGCPHDCSFCIVSKMQGRKNRKKTIPQIVEEVKTIQKLFGSKLIGFIDDNLFIDKKFAKSLLRELIPLKIKFCAQSDVGMADDEELLKLAYAAGLQLVLIGFESLDSNSLMSIDPGKWKHGRLQKYEDAVYKIQNNGIVVYGTFIIGFETDDKNIFQLMRDFVAKTFCNAQFSALTPYPGTRLYEEMHRDNGAEATYDWSKFSNDDIVKYSTKIGKKGTEDGLIWLYKEVYNEQMATLRKNYMKEIFRKLPPRWAYEGLSPVP